jgi:polyadenylate-binding protein
MWVYKFSIVIIFDFCILSFIISFYFLGDLTEDVQEDHLINFVTQKLGPNVIESVKVCRDHNPPFKSLRYGYINFYQIDDAQKALETLNYQPILHNRTCRMMWTQPNSTLRRSGIGNVCVKNLPLNYQTRQLHNLFYQYGSIVSCRISEYRGNRGTSHGFVQFRTQEEADHAIETLNNQEIEGNKISVEKFRNRDQFIHKSVFISGLPDTFGGEDLKQTFKEVGKVERTLITKSQRDQSRLFGFVWFETEAEASRAVADLNGKKVKINGGGILQNDNNNNSSSSSSSNDDDYFTISLAIARPKWERVRFKKQLREQTRFRNLYVRGIPSTFKKADLDSIFSKYGKIASSVVMMQVMEYDDINNDDDNNNNNNGGGAGNSDYSNNSSSSSSSSSSNKKKKRRVEVAKGFGFCCYSTDEEARKAINELNGKEIAVPVFDDDSELVKKEKEGGKVTLLLSYAQTKEERQAMMQRRRTNSFQNQHNQFGFNNNYFGNRFFNNQYDQPHPMLPHFQDGRQYFNHGGYNANYNYNNNNNNNNNRPFQNYNDRFNQPHYYQHQQQWNTAANLHPSSSSSSSSSSSNIQYNRGGNATDSSINSSQNQSSNISVGKSFKTTNSKGQTVELEPVKFNINGNIPQPASSSSSSSTGGGAPSTSTTGSVSSSITSVSFMSLSAQEKKQYLGELLFPSITKLDEPNAGKITGMIIELDLEVIVDLLHRPAELVTKVREAQQILTNADEDGRNN